jgi:hypothetical protein
MYWNSLQVRKSADDEALNSTKFLMHAENCVNMPVLLLPNNFD